MRFAIKCLVLFGLIGFIGLAITEGSFKIGSRFVEIAGIPLALFGVIIAWPIAIYIGQKTGEQIERLWPDQTSRR